MATTIWAKSKLIKNKIVPFYKNWYSLLV
jgi:hypothetical protein